MSYVFDVNNSAVTGAQAMYKFKELLKTAGWVVKSSGDGLSAFSSTTDIITSGSSGANGFANSNAWVRIQMPIANGVHREFILQRSSSNILWTILYSYSVGFIGGSPSATIAPTATDSKTINPGSFFTTDSTYRLNIAADNAAPYGFWMGCFPIGGGSPSGGAFCLLPIYSNATQDVDPYVIYAESSSSFTISSSLINTPNTWYRKGLSGELFQIVSACKLICVNDSGNSCFPSGVGVNPHNGNDDVIDIPFSSSPATSGILWPYGFKGLCSFMKWNGSSRTTGDTLSLAGSKDRIIYRDVNLPWNGSSVLI
jgi:hypothetical protein